MSSVLFSSNSKCLITPTNILSRTIHLREKGFAALPTNDRRLWFAEHDGGVSHQRVGGCRVVDFLMYMNDQSKCLPGVGGYQLYMTE